MFCYLFPERSEGFLIGTLVNGLNDVCSSESVGARSKYGVTGLNTRGGQSELSSKFQPLLPLSGCWSRSQLPRPILAICSFSEWLLGRVWVTSLSEKNPARSIPDFCGRAGFGMSYFRRDFSRQMAWSSGRVSSLSIFHDIKATTNESR